MELILNDLSLRGQFADLDEFEDYFMDYLDELLTLIIDRKIPLFKKSDTYSRRITNDTTLDQYLRKINSPVATHIKVRIIDMAYHEPYWDDADQIKSKTGVCYQYPDKQPEPNCFTEAIERGCPLLSVREDVMTPSARTEEEIECYRDRELVKVADIINRRTFLDAYIKDDRYNIRFAIEHCQKDKIVKCAELAGRCYTESALLENNLNGQDIRKFLDHIQTLIDDKSSGRKTHWWDSIRDDICEYRVSVSDGRELRVLFAWGKELIFLNGFVKKTDKTPPNEIKLAERIKNGWIH